MLPSRAITATVHDPGAHFGGWCHYHRRLFDLVLVWADEVADFEALRHLADDGIVVALGAQMPHGSRLTRTLLRQDANANAALGECVRRRIDWLLHIDSDELFRPLDPNAWKQRPDVSQLRFVNHEACPRWTAGDPFRTIRHFKRSGRVPFLLYEGGKAAVRCAPGVRADGPHRFTAHPGRCVISSKAEILHYGCCSYDAWLRKYKRLGVFSDWYKDDFRTPITKCFHLKSRDIVLKCSEDGDMRLCQKFYGGVVWRESQLQEGLSSGNLIHVPRGALYGID